MYKIILLIITALFLDATFSNTAFAQTPTPTCQTINNGGATCPTTSSLKLTKTIQDPRNGAFTNNLLQQDYVFSRGQTLTFHLTITNTSNGNTSNVTTIDTLPANLDYAGGDGTFDATKRTVTILLPSLAANSSKTFTIKAKVNSQAFPNNQSPVCLSNQAIVQIKQFFFFTFTQNQTSSVVCLSDKALTPQQIQDQTQTPPQTSGGQPVYGSSQPSQSPATGPTLWDLLLLLPMALVGMKLRDSVSRR